MTSYEYMDACRIMSTATLTEMAQSPKSTSWRFYARNELAERAARKSK